MKKYHSIVRYGKTGTREVLEGNPIITIEEKIDGANASFKRVGDELVCFSRNTQLNNENNLRGFYQWAQENVFINKVPEDLVFFGEWAAKHKLDYGENHDTFYLFDVFDEDKDVFLGFDVVDTLSRKLSLNKVPLMYRGEFQSLEHIQSFVGKSKLGNIGEGVVVKNHSYRNKFGKQVYLKFVSDQFAEIAKTKKHKVNQNKDMLQDFVDATVNKARISKIIHKLVDEGLLKQDYTIEDMGAILKNTGSRVYEDIVNEELDELLKLLKSRVGRKVPNVVKEVLAEEGRM